MKNGCSAISGLLLALLLTLVGGAEARAGQSDFPCEGKYWVCELSGNAGEVVECPLILVRKPEGLTPPSGADFKLSWDSSLASIDYFEYEVCIGDVCMDNQIPTCDIDDCVWGSLTSGHVIVAVPDDIGDWDGEGTLLFFHATNPAKPISQTYLDPGDNLVGTDALYLTGKFTLLQDVEAESPVVVWMSSAHFSLSTGENLAFSMQQTDIGRAVVASQNVAPVADSGPDRTVQQGASVTLDGSGSCDPSDEIESYQWVQTAGTAVVLSDATAVKPTFTAPQVSSQGETLTFALTVKDGDGLQSTEPCTVNVTCLDRIEKPILSAPSNGLSGVPLCPQLQTGAYSDLYDDTPQGETEWEVSDDSSFSTCVFSSRTSIYLTSLSMPAMVLDTNNTYYWRVKFYDNADMESEWSDTFSFTTLTQSDEDTNLNGIPDDREVDPALDLDGDGTPDISQDDIKCVNTAGGDLAVGIKGLSGGASIQSVTSMDQGQISDDLNRPSSLSFGLIGFKVKVAKAGDTASVRLFFSSPLPARERWYKYSTQNGWQDYSAHAVFSADRKSLTLELRDGGHGDGDGAANGVILDPSGPGEAPSSPGASNSGTGCFIAVLTDGPE